MLKIFLGTINKPAEGLWFDLTEEVGREDAMEVWEGVSELIISDYEADFPIKETSNIVELVELGETFEEMTELQQAVLTHLIDDQHGDISGGISDFENVCILGYYEGDNEDIVRGNALIGNDITPEGFDADTEAAKYFDYEHYGKDMRHYGWVAIEYNNGFIIYG